MLCGEDLGRRHERRLKAVLYHGEADRRGNRRLARADVALYKAVHLGRLTEHIVNAVGNRPLLRARQLKRKQLFELSGEVLVYLHAAERAAVVAQAAHSEIEHDKLLGDEPSARVLEVGGCFGKMDILYRLSQSAEVELLPDTLGQRVADRFGQHFQRLLHRALYRL